MSGYNHFMQKISALLISVILFTTGCATARPRPSSEEPEQTSQAAELQNQIRVKDQQIQDLQSQLESAQRSLLVNYSTKSGQGKSSSIWVSGVTEIDVQKALVRSGYEPGPPDGHYGKKTKKAIKAFQKKNGLFADGIVGEKTWALLNP